MNILTDYPFFYIDIALLSLLAVVSEIMGTGLLNICGSSFYFSFTMAISLIAMIRWGFPGVLAGIIGGIPCILFSDMSVLNGILFYVLANISAGIPILVYGSRDRNQIAENPLLLMLYVLLSHICLSAGKGTVIYLLSGEVTGMADYFGATFFITVVNVIVCLVLRMREGLICDMRYYFTQGEGEPDERYSN